VERTPSLDPPLAGPALKAYFLGRVEFERALALQRRLVYDVAGGAAACLLFCEHPPTITVGRQGSHDQLRLDETERVRRGWTLRWVNRGGSSWLHLPGQLAVYPIIPLRELGLTVGEYCWKLQAALVGFLAELELPAHGLPEVWVGSRPIAAIGVAVRDWVAYYGAVLNVNPDLEGYRLVRTGKGHPPMTSLQRECRRPVRPGEVRERLLAHLAARLGFARTYLFAEHPLLQREAPTDALTPSR
jgi:lipoyl(octanoyl) transferase